MNRLAKATSPYLLQHKDNPVDWREWGAEAFAEAKATGRPVLLSVGYAACHWCHVMAHESFEDEGVAAVMNELFVNIKVDREERPDVDHIYMSALHLLGEQGGWPLTMFLHARRRAVLGRHLLPEGAEIRPARLRQRAARGVARLPRRAGADRPQPAPPGRAPRRGRAGPGRRPRPWPCRSRRRRRAPRRRLRPGAWRPQRCAEIPEPDDGRVPRPLRPPLGQRRGEGPRPRHARADSARRHPRPSRRRLRALFGRRALAGAAFREDALRQRPVAGALRPLRRRDRLGAVPLRRRGHRRLARSARW